MWARLGRLGRLHVGAIAAVPCALSLSYIRPCEMETKPAPAKPGRAAAIYLSMGPSGAGKDTLLLGAREAFAKAGDDRVQFLQRDITRSADLTTDLEANVSPEEFKRKESAGEYALSWHAHKTCYGITTASLEAGLAAEKRLVLNVSRTVVDKVLKEYKEKRGVEVYCIALNATDATLKKRLLARGRETPTEVDERVRRARMGDPYGEHVITVFNEATIEEGIDLTQKALTGSLKYSLWLVPQDAEWGTAAKTIIKDLSSEHNMHSFPPHITIGKSFVTNQEDACERARRAADSLNPVVIQPTTTSTSSAFFRAAVFKLKLTKELEAAHSAVLKATQPDGFDIAADYRPHVSFLYGVHDNDVLSRAEAKLRRKAGMTGLTDEFTAQDLVLVMTSGAAYQCWTEVARYPLRWGNPVCALKI